MIGDAGGCDNVQDNDLISPSLSGRRVAEATRSRGRDRKSAPGAKPMLTHLSSHMQIHKVDCGEADGSLADRRNFDWLPSCERDGGLHEVRLRPIDPLTFNPALGEDRVDLPRRPVAKCTVCGERTYASFKPRRPLPPV